MGAKLTSIKSQMIKPPESSERCNINFIRNTDISFDRALTGKIVRRMRPDIIAHNAGNTANNTETEKEPDAEFLMRGHLQLVQSDERDREEHQICDHMQPSVGEIQLGRIDTMQRFRVFQESGPEGVQIIVSVDRGTLKYC